MSLKQFLPVGKSFLGTRDAKSPFEMRKEELLPIFDNAPRFSNRLAPAEAAEAQTLSLQQGLLSGVAIERPAAPIVTSTTAKQAAPTIAPQKRSWLSRLTFGLFGRPPAGGHLVQAELRLEKVRVVRNDLADSDLELIIKKKKKGRVFNPQHVPDATEHGWSRMAARLFEVGQNR